MWYFSIYCVAAGLYCFNPFPPYGRDSRVGMETKELCLKVAKGIARDSGFPDDKWAIKCEYRTVNYKTN